MRAPDDHSHSPRLPPHLPPHTHPLQCKRSVDKAMPGAPHDVLLVLDGTTGLNMLNQVGLVKHYDTLGLYYDTLRYSIDGDVLLVLDGTGAPYMLNQASIMTLLHI